MDLPWLFLILLNLLFAPWRLLTTYKNLYLHNDHFPDHKITTIRLDLITFTLYQSFLDYLNIPFFITATLLNPFSHIAPVFRLYLKY